MPRDKKVVLNEIDEIYSRLSPENLSCDGEIPWSECQKEAAKLQKKLDALFIEYGREVGEVEAYDLLHGKHRLEESSL